MPATPASVLRLLVVAERGPKLRRRIKSGCIEWLERRGHDAHDPVFTIIHHDGAADDRGIRTESTTPQLIAENQHAPPLGTIIVCCKGPPERRLNAHHVEIVPTHPDGRQAFGFGLAHERWLPRSH